MKTSELKTAAYNLIRNFSERNELGERTYAFRKNVIKAMKAFEVDLKDRNVALKELTDDGIIEVVDIYVPNADYPVSAYAILKPYNPKTTER